MFRFVSFVFRYFSAASLQSSILVSCIAENQQKIREDIHRNTIEAKKCKTERLILQRIVVHICELVFGGWSCDALSMGSSVNPRLQISRKSLELDSNVPTSFEDHSILTAGESCP